MFFKCIEQVTGCRSFSSIVNLGSLEVTITRVKKNCVAYKLVKGCQRIKKKGYKSDDIYTSLFVGICVSKRSVNFENCIYILKCKQIKVVKIKSGRSNRI